MDSAWLKKYQPYIITAALVFFMGIALILRMIPAGFIKDPGFLYLFDTDTWYTLRQVEVMVRDFPHYNWFDPMTAYPTGKMIDWGPLFPGIAAIICLITGATGRSEIIFVSGMVAPLMATVMVPLMYSLGKTVWTQKAGLIAAGLIAVVSIQYFSLSSYGWADHHIAEVLFSTLFFLSYLVTLSHVIRHPVDLKKRDTVYVPLLYSGITGVLFFLALLASTTVLLTLAVIAVYTLVQSIMDCSSTVRSHALLFVNGVFLILASILLILFGLRHEGFSFSQYSIGIVFVQAALVIGTIVLFILNSVVKGKKPACIISLAVLAMVSLVVIQGIPQLQMMAGQAVGLLFGFSIYSVAVVETLPWTLSSAWENFHFSLILMAGGFLVLGYAFTKKKDPLAAFLLVWSVVMLLLTIRFQRFAYYLTVPVVLLAAICIDETFSRSDGFFTRYGLGMVSKSSNPSLPHPDTRNVETGKRSKQGKIVTKKMEKPAGKSPENNHKFLKNGIIAFVLLLTAGLVAVSVSQDIAYGVRAPQREIPSDWIESLAWMEKNTPPPGIDYFTVYEAQGFSYPPESYGIVAVWDAGHWITFFSKRIPVTNPFQDNLGGRAGTAAYFLSQNESQADAILQGLGGKYVVTNSDMAIDTFTNLVPWQSNSVDISPYIKWFMSPDPDNPRALKKIHLYDTAYFTSKVVRLHNFDGSMVIPEQGTYLQYEIRQVPAAGETSEDVRGYARVISAGKEMDISPGTLSIVREGADLSPGRYADIFSPLPNQTHVEIAALNHYRLIHESSNDASVKMFPESDVIRLPDIKYVKIFEYVKGAPISGNGIIELPVVTNTGRTFIYRQESQEGKFVVPYSTEGNPYAVRAAGKYHIVGTTRYITVTEKDVTEGNKPLE